MNARRYAVLACLPLIVGCGGQDASRNAPATATWRAEKSAGAPVADVKFAKDGPGKHAEGGEEPIAPQIRDNDAIPAGIGKPPTKAARKIKYTADLKLITDDFDKTRSEITSLIDKHHGYEALADVSSSPGQPRRGTWRVRVPIENFTPFREAIRRLAEVENDTVNTEDLTEQYYDLEANIKNLKAEQDSWREMLKKTTDKVEHLIAVKKELDRVTDEIMRKEGRLRLLANLTDLTTVSIHLRERQKYVPEKAPEPVQPATFGMKADKTFTSSWDALYSFGEGLALIAVAVTPWLPLLVIIGAPLWIATRRLRRVPKSVTPVETPPSPPAV